MSLDDSSQRRRRVLRIAAVVVAAVLGAGSPASAATLPAGGLAAGRVLGGVTSQHWPVVVAISTSGKQIQGASAGLVLSCSSGAVFPVPDGWGNVPIRAHGNVNASAGIPPSGGNSTGAITGGSDTFNGRLDRRRATFRGTWRLHVNYLMSNGQTDQCDSGPVAFSARL